LEARRAGDGTLDFQRRSNWTAAKVAEGNGLAEVEEPADGAVPVLRDALEGEDPLVREHARWALERLRWA